MNKFTLSGIATALALAVSPAANAADFYIDNPANPASGSFTTKSAAPGFTSVTAEFDNTVTAPGFNDTFFFRLPLSGTGSGSLSTTFTSNANKITITDVIITTLGGVFTYGAADIMSSPTGQLLLSGAIPVIGDPDFFNKIQVIGTTNGTGTYSGVVSFATAIPEASTWALMILGVGAVGFAARRSRKPTVRVKYA
ncbi:FxDxF family PEP-CTERM protein [Novosphingobium sp. M1R2S20]|uniref:FxDxF family PEP-CTERM protein n=1 Tax=Novosphingobium rhizovicinum TaxID=3228928 RepID=A0ABV3R8Q6_9SPHN